MTSLKGLLSLLDHLLLSYTCPVHLNTIIRYSSLIRLYECVLPCLFKYHLLVKQCIFFYFVSGWLIKSVIFFISYFVCMCLDTCSSWQYHWTCAMTFDPTHFAMVTISFLSPLLLPAHILVLCLSSDSPWIKVPMMHGATTSTVSSASTPVTNVPFAESAASNQVCSFISVLFLF